jgi:hypothetical protein
MTSVIGDNFSGRQRIVWQLTFLKSKGNGHPRYVLTVYSSVVKRSGAKNRSNSEMSRQVSEASQIAILFVDDQ